MDYQKKVDRVNELVKEIKERETELAGIFGGEAPKKTWSRRAKEEGNGNQGAVETA